MYTVQRHCFSDSFIPVIAVQPVIICMTPDLCLSLRLLLALTTEGCVGGDASLACTAWANQVFLTFFFFFYSHKRVFAPPFCVQFLD